jgi:hypothetical protein
MADVDGAVAELDEGAGYSGDGEKNTVKANLDDEVVYGWDSGAKGGGEVVRGNPKLVRGNP